MSYTCQHCGVTANTSTSLCNPTRENLDTKFCGTDVEAVCEEKLTSMKYACDICGSVSADAAHLCSPSSTNN